MKLLCYSLSKYCKLRGKQKSYHSQQPQHTKQFSVESEINHFEEGWILLRRPRNRDRSVAVCKLCGAAGKHNKSEH